MNPGRRKLTGVLLGLVVLLGSAPAHGGETWIYLCPTLGVWRWDRSGYPDFDVNLHGEVWGLRGGYAPTRAFAAELVALTGTNNARTGSGEPSATLRQTLLEISLLVKFQSLGFERFYPFLDLGAGLAFRRGGPPENAEVAVDDEQLAFHLGGGLLWELDRQWALRLNIRDSFFTDDRLVGNAGEQLTVDSLEFSLGVVLGFRIGSTGRPRLESGRFDDAPKGE